MNHYYRIDGVGEMFRTLHDAKYHVCAAYTHEERKKYLNGCSIIKIVNDVAVTSTEIIVTDKNYKFSKTKMIV